MQVAEKLLMKLDDVGQVLVDGRSESRGECWKRSKNRDVDLEHGY